MIYFDHAATTPCEKNVVDEMMPLFNEHFANAGSLHTLGRYSASYLSQAREIIAKCINANSDEVYFTASGSEADNWAIKGVAHANLKCGNHIIASSIEHHALLNSTEWLKTLGYEVTYLPVDKQGLVNPTDLENAITDKTILVSVMYVNNEVGTIEPIKELCEIAHKHNCLFHTDCVQAMPYIKLDVKELDVDLVSMSAHKFYGPKGVGALYIKHGTSIDNLISGGEQERGLRAGTPNTPGVYGMAKALESAVAEMDVNNKHIANLRNHFVDRIKNEIDNIVINGCESSHVPSVASVSFLGVDSSMMLTSLDIAGICASSGPACSAGSLGPSHVLLAMQLDSEVVHSAIRFSFGKNNTIEEVDEAVEKIKQIVSRLRGANNLFNLLNGELHNI